MIVCVTQTIKCGSEIIAFAFETVNFASQIIISSFEAINSGLNMIIFASKTIKSGSEAIWFEHDMVIVRPSITNCVLVAVFCRMEISIDTTEISIDAIVAVFARAI